MSAKKIWISMAEASLITYSKSVKDCGIWETAYSLFSSSFVRCYKLHANITSSKAHAIRIREQISVPFIHTHPTIQQTMSKRNSYQFSLGTSAWSHNPAPIAAMAVQYRAIPDPADASSLRDDGTPTHAHFGRSVCERSPKERRWFSEEILSSLDLQPHLLEEYLQNIDFNIISTSSLRSLFLSLQEEQ